MTQSTQVRQVRNLTLVRKEDRVELVGTFYSNDQFHMILSIEQTVLLCKQAFNIAIATGKGHQL